MTTNFARSAGFLVSATPKVLQRWLHLACMRFSIGARKPPASPVTTTMNFTRTVPWAMLRAISTAMKSSTALSDAAPLATSAIQQRAKHRCAMCSHYMLTLPPADLRSRITAIFQTRLHCAVTLSAAVRYSSHHLTLKSSSIWWRRLDTARCWTA